MEKNKKIKITLKKKKTIIKDQTKSKKKTRGKGKKKIKLPKIPNELIIIPNKDKEFHEGWTKNRKSLNIIHPFRCVILAPPNLGKSTTAKNLLMHQEPPFERVIIVHCDPDYTREYEDVENVELLSEIPKPNDEGYFDGIEKTLVILDDLEYKMMLKEQKRCLDRLFGFVSTHKNISVILCAQDPFNVPPCVRRMSNFWILWKLQDLDALYTLARRTGIPKNEFFKILHSFKNKHDSFWIDGTKDTPFPYRKNGTIPLDVKGY